MTTVIDGPAALELLRKAVSSRGGSYVYKRRPTPDGNERCLYWHDDERRPGCIVGLALSRAGVEPSQLRALDSREGGTAAYELPVRDLGDVQVTAEGAEVFASAQAVQDSGGKWLTALAWAEDVVAERAAGAAI